MRDLFSLNLIFGMMIGFGAYGIIENFRWHPDSKTNPIVFSKEINGQPPIPLVQMTAYGVLCVDLPAAYDTWKKQESDKSSNAKVKQP